MPFNKQTEDLIANFRGLPSTVSSSSLRPPLELHTLVEQLETRYQFERVSPERVLVENWTRIFGSKLAQRCHPVRIVDERVLVLSVQNQTLRSELNFMKRSLLKRIQALEHCDRIQDIRTQS